MIAHELTDHWRHARKAGTVGAPRKSDIMGVGKYPEPESRLASNTFFVWGNMVSFKELLGNTNITDIPVTHVQNMEELLKKVNVLREAWGKPWVVTSGYRSMQDHLRIYSAKGIPAERVPLKSQHLTGSAIDIYDPGLQITAWLKENDSSRLQAVGLYCEEGNSNWVHLQLNPPKSGRRWFLP